MNSEMKSKGWLWGAIGLQLCTGYTVALLINQFGTLFTEGHFAAGFVPGLIAVIVIVAIIAYLIRKANKNIAAEYALKNAAKA